MQGTKKTNLSNKEDADYTPKKNRKVKNPGKWSQEENN